MMLTDLKEMMKDHLSPIDFEIVFSEEGVYDEFVEKFFKKHYVTIGQT
jgi:hypothetical protein